jgi:hypothetical protein
MTSRRTQPQAVTGALRRSERPSGALFFVEPEPQAGVFFDEELDELEGIEMEMEEMEA